jgi:hypothetical protein
VQITGRGTNELDAGQVLIRPMNSGDQYTVERAQLVTAIRQEVSNFREAN